VKLEANHLIVIKVLSAATFSGAKGADGISAAKILIEDDGRELP
jgi:hypothetical protein